VEAESYGSCGATTTKQRIDEYFDQVAAFLNASGDRTLLRNLVADNVVLVEDGRARTVSASEIIARPDAISLDDWTEIGRRGEPRLASGGWRGCFFSHGKAAFQVVEGGQLRLTSFNLDRPWSDPSEPE
jgi:hypothetical protein